MKFIDFIRHTKPGLLEKVAGAEQDALVDLLEKQAQYTVHLLLEKLAEGEEAQEEAQEAEAEQGPINPDGSPVVGSSQTPHTGGQENAMMDDNRPSSSIKVNDIKNAVEEALAAGAGEKIVGFVQALASQQPEAINEVIKIIKVQLHSAFMNKQIDEESAVKVSDGLNALLDGGKGNE